MNPSRQQIEAGAKALWEISPHSMLAGIGYPVDWESQGVGIKSEYMRKAKAVLSTLTNPTTSEGAENE